MLARRAGGKPMKCPVCGESLQLRECRYALHMGLMFGLAAVVFLASRELPDPCGLFSFLLVFTAAAVGVTALVQFYRWGCAAPVPLVEKRPEG
jgi:hypothetical protein